MECAWDPSTLGMDRTHSKMPHTHTLSILQPWQNLNTCQNQFFHNQKKFQANTWFKYFWIVTEKVQKDDSLNFKLIYLYIIMTIMLLPIKVSSRVSYMLFNFWEKNSKNGFPLRGKNSFISWQHWKWQWKF